VDEQGGRQGPGAESGDELLLLVGVDGDGLAVLADPRLDARIDQRGALVALAGGAPVGGDDGQDDAVLLGAALDGLLEVEPVGGVGAVVTRKLRRTKSATIARTPRKAMLPSLCAALAMGRRW